MCRGHWAACQGSRQGDFQLTDELRHDRVENADKFATFGKERHSAE